MIIFFQKNRPGLDFKYRDCLLACGLYKNSSQLRGNFLLSYKNI